MTTRYVNLTVTVADDDYLVNEILRLGGSLLDRSAIVTISTNVHTIGDPIEPVEEDRVQALIEYLGHEIALEALEDRAVDVMTTDYESRPERPPSAREIADGIPIRAANGEIIRTVPR